MFGVFFRRVFVVIVGVQRVSVRHLGVVRGFFVIPGLGVFGGFAMVLRGMLVVFRGLLMMLVDFVAVHSHLQVSRSVAISSIARIDETIATSAGAGNLTPRVE
jgi:hypothetical protein